MRIVQPFTQINTKSHSAFKMFAEIFVDIMEKSNTAYSRVIYLLFFLRKIALQISLQTFTLTSRVDFDVLVFERSWQTIKAKSPNETTVEDNYTSVVVQNIRVELFFRIMHAFIYTDTNVNDDSSFGSW